jgi:hypothetical protein
MRFARIFDNLAIQLIRSPAFRQHHFSPGLFQFWMKTTLSFGLKVNQSRLLEVTCTPL